MDQERIGAFIRQTRKEAGLTQEQLAEKLGVSQKSVSRWETGRTMPDYSLLLNLCETLHVNVAELLGAERADGEGIPKEQVTAAVAGIISLCSSKKAIRRIIGAVVAAIVMFACAIGVYNLEFNVSVESTSDLEQAINEYHFNDEVSADVLERQAIRNRLYVLYGENAYPGACGLACLEKGIFGKYRFISCEDSDYRWIHADQTAVGHTKYCITYCVNDLPGVDAYGFGDTRIDYHGSPFIDVTEIAEGTVIEPLQIRYYIGDEERTVDDLEKTWEDRVVQGAPAAGYGTAELGMVYVVEGIILLVGFVFIRYLLDDIRRKNR